MMIQNKFFFLVILGIFALFSIFFSLSKGSIFLTLDQLMKACLGQANPLINEIVFNLRLPRTLAAFITGGLLGLSGAMMQVLLRNPLADPYILGVSGGAAISVLLCILLGISGWALTGSAWLGSLIVIFLVFQCSQKKLGIESERILLTGIALSSGFAAIVSFILIMSPQKKLHSMLFWLVGDLSDTHLPILESIILLIAFPLSYRMGNELNLLLRGEEEAKALGVNPLYLKKQLYFLTALLTAAAVTLAGCIGFVGLIVPHLLRLLCGHDHRFLLPGCLLLGGSLLTLADTLSRTLFAPTELPVGITMTLLGVPIFLFLLRKHSL